MSTFLSLNSPLRKDRRNDEHEVKFILSIKQYDYSRLSCSWKTRARTSMLSLFSFSSVPGTWKAVCGTRLALPSFFESKHLMRMTSSGLRFDL